ncbi:MAG TPA: alpha/beta hydrolase, partial [Streptosporangiaceae bacterium]
AESVSYLRSYPFELPILAERLGEILVPVQIISGRNDPYVPTANGDFLYDHLPKSRVHILDAGHFVWEEAAVEYGRLVTEWVLHNQSTACGNR